jgi:hypothetical protein
MTNQHPITPPPELVQQWQKRFEQGADIYQLFTSIFQAGADQELQACINFIYDNELCDPNFYKDLRAARRPKPPSLKEQALDRCNDYIDPDGIIRRALEQLND